MDHSGESIWEIDGDILFNLQFVPDADFGYCCIFCSKKKRAVSHGPVITSTKCEADAMRMWV